MIYESTTFWQEYEISLKNYEISQFESKTETKDIGYWLKYYRMVENISQDQLAKIIGLKYGNYIKDIEIGIKYPNREISKKLASYFKIGTKYFHDPYLEETEQIHIILLEYRKNNNLKIKEAAKLINVSPGTWSKWEKQKYEATRENYYKLKELGIIP